MAYAPTITRSCQQYAYLNPPEKVAKIEISDAKPKDDFKSDVQGIVPSAATDSGAADSSILVNCACPVVPFTGNGYQTLTDIHVGVDCCELQRQGYM